MYCNKCETEHKIEMFREDRKRNNGYHPYCKSCEKTLKREWYLKNIDHVKTKAKKRNYENKEHVALVKKRWQQTNKDKVRAIGLKYSFGITIENYSQMLSSQHDACAICRIAPEEDTWLCVDHDHKTGVIRGLLCGSCNKMLGFAKDREANLEAAISYLRKTLCTIKS